jgi:NHL repeat
VRTTAHTATTASTPKTGLLALLGSLLRVKGTGASKTTKGTSAISYDTSTCRPVFLVALGTAAIFALLIVFAGSAFASTEHGEHTTGTPFGGPGSGPGEFNGLAGVATNNATGDVYVVDSGNNRVERFRATGAYLGQFNGSGTYEVEGGKVETDFLTPPGPLSGPEGIAVDNDPSSPSYQDVYVADPSISAIDKFGPTGEYKSQITGADGGNLAHLRGIAVDPSGVLWVYRYNAEEENANEEFNEIESYSGAEPSVFISGQVLSIKHEAQPGIAVDGSGDLYVVTNTSSVDELNSTGEILAENFCGQKTVSGLAVEASSNDLYIDSGGTKVVRCSPSGKAIESETMPVAGGARSDTVAVNSSNGYVYATNATAHAVDVFPPFAGASIHEEQASSVEAIGATLEALIAPNAYDTTYHFEYDTTPYTGSASHGTSTPDVATQTTTSLLTIGARAKQLHESTTYYYRAVVESAVEVEGKPETVTVDGPSESFTTPAAEGSAPPQNCANEQRRAEQPFGLELPDCRAYESVSPVDTEGLNATEPDYDELARAAEEGAPEHPTIAVPQQDEGGAVTYDTAGAFGRPTGATSENQYLSRRNPAKGGWETRAITPPHEPDQTESHGSYEANLFTPDLAAGIAQTNAALPETGAPKTPASTIRELNLYDADFPGEASPATYRYIATEPEAEPLGASTDLSHVVFGEFGTVSEWFEGMTLPVSVDNNDDAMGSATIAGWHGVSADGSRVFFSSEGQLFERVNAEHEQSRTVSPEASGNGTLEKGSEEVSSLTLVAGLVVQGANEGSSVIRVEVLSGRFVVGQPISGGPLASETTIEKITPGPGIGLVGHSFAGTYYLTLSKPTTNFLYPETIISSEGPSPFAPGQTISGNGILPGTTITKAEQGRLTLSQPAASSGSGVALYAGGGCTVAAKACTVLVSASQRLLENRVGPQEAKYSGASADGSRVFFTSTAELTEDADTTSGAANLYEYDLAKPEGKRLTDLTVPTEAEQVEDPDGAAVQGVAQISEDGSYVYFVANGLLTSAVNARGEHAKPGNCEPAGKGVSCNLYLFHNGVTTFITTLGAEDGEVWDGGPNTNTAVVSLSGSYLAFLAKTSLTGYDNEQAQPGDCEGESRSFNEGENGKCREAYLYDAESGKLVCASCDPTGARPLGPANFGKPRPTKNLYRPRVLTADGTLFFDSYDALVTHSSDGLQNVYEYEDGQIAPISNVSGGFESFLLDTSASGGDVFFGTAEQLLPEDTGGDVVVYDARIDGGFPILPAAPSCNNADSCKPPESAQPAIFGEPASATFSGPGNATPPPPAVVKPKPKSKTVKCKRGFVKNKKGKCIKKPKKKSKRAKKAGHGGRTKS